MLAQSVSTNSLRTKQLAGADVEVPAVQSNKAALSDWEDKAKQQQMAQEFVALKQRDEDHKRKETELETLRKKQQDEIETLRKQLEDQKRTLKELQEREKLEEKQRGGGAGGCCVVQ